MKKIHKIGLYLFIGFVFLFLAISLAKAIELLGKYAESLELLYVCKADKALSLNEDKDSALRAQLFLREEKSKKVKNYNEIIDTLQSKIENAQIQPQEKEAFKEFVKHDSVESEVLAPINPPPLK